MCSAGELLVFASFARYAPFRVPVTQVTGRACGSIRRDQYLLSVAGASSASNMSCEHCPSESALVSSVSGPLPRATARHLCNGASENSLSLGPSA